MKNNNDNTAKYYDLVSNFTKNTDITNQEYILLKKYINHDSEVLEIGSGSGRHSTIIAPLVKSLICVDSSEEMNKLHNLKIKNLKLNNVRILNDNFLQMDISEWKIKFNFIYLMWNTFNEIILTEKESRRFFQKCKEILSPRGKILINIDDSALVDPSNFDFEYEIKLDKEVIHYFWKTLKYTSKTNTSVSQEVIEISSPNILKKTLKTKITQRYWKGEQLLQSADSAKIQFVKNENIKGNGELYLVFRS